MQNAIQNVAIIGFGSLGAMYAGCFGAKMGASHVFVVADEVRTKRYRQEAASFNGKTIRATYLSYDEAIPYGPFDVVLFAVKYGALDEASNQAAKLVGANTAIVSVLNGITSEEFLAKKFGWDQVLLCIAQQMDSRKVGAEVIAGCTGVLALGIHDNDNRVQQQMLARVTSWLAAIEQPFIVPDDIHHQLWGKLICNVGVNQACTVYDCCFDGIQKEGEARDAMIAAMNEVVAVAQAYGINLSDNDVVYWLDIIDALNPEGMPSLRQDVLAKRPTEVELFSGTINRLGRELAVPTPQNEQFYAAIKEIEAAY